MRLAITSIGRCIDQADSPFSSFRHACFPILLIRPRQNGQLNRKVKISRKACRSIIYALHDSANTLTKINLSGETLAVYATPASGAEEGVVLVEPPSTEDTYIVLADDAGPIAIRYDHFQSTDTDESSESTVSAAVLWLILRASQPPMD